MDSVIPNFSSGANRAKSSSMSRACLELLIERQEVWSHESERPEQRRADAQNSEVRMSNPPWACA